MKALVSALAMLLAALSVPARAQDDGAERARIAGERKVVEDRFAAEKKACNARFAVTDCVEKATRARNAALGDLRRQERVLNDADRRQRAAERLKELQERDSPERRREAEERRVRGLAEQKEREERAAAKAQKRSAEQARRAQDPRPPRQPASAPAPQGGARIAPGPKAPPMSAEDAARNRAEYEARFAEAERHKAEVRARVARRAKPAASGLPVPQ